MAAPNTKSEDKSSKVKLTFERARWPKINLENEIKEDLLRSFNIFDKEGQGLVSLDDVKVTFCLIIYLLINLVVKFVLETYYETIDLAF